MGNSKRVLKRPISLLHGKTDCLHVLLTATQKGGVFIRPMAVLTYGQVCGVNCLEAADG